MDIFDVLTAISEKKETLLDSGMNERDAIEKAKLDIARDYRISLLDIKKLVGENKVRREQRFFFQAFSPSFGVAASSY